MSAIDAELARRARNRIDRYFPDAGPVRRELYAKHMEFFKAGAIHRERAFIAGNRVGKTESAGGYEISCHLTGRYPPWWVGRRFTGPVKVWVSGETAKKVREVVQTKLFGPTDAFGTGMIPGDLILHVTKKAGTADAIDTAWVKHATGHNSHLTLKSYEMGREGFDGDFVHVIWLDEEPSGAIYTECLLRTAKTEWFEGGMIIMTMTPLRGMSEVVTSFFQQASNRMAVNGGSFPEDGKVNVQQGEDKGTSPQEAKVGAEG